MHAEKREPHLLFIVIFMKYEVCAKQSSRGATGPFFVRVSAAALQRRHTND